MLAWPHSGFHVHDGVWVAADDHEFAVYLLISRFGVDRPLPNPTPPRSANASIPWRRIPTPTTTYVWLAVLMAEVKPRWEALVEWERSTLGS